MSDPYERLSLVKKFWRDRTVGPFEAIHPFSGKTIKVDPQKDAMISSDLGKELTRVVGLYYWYRALRDRAAEAYREARYNEHVTHEDLYGEFRATAPKATTETAINMKVRSDSRMRAAFRARMDARTMLDRLENAVATLDKKSGVLQSLGKLQQRETGMRDSV